MAERRIAVDARPLCHPGTGIYRYTHELLSRMCRLGGQWFFYSPQHYDTTEFDLPNVHHRVAGLPSRLRASQLAQLFFPGWIKRDQVDAFWGPRHQLPLVMPAQVRSVVTIHDLVWKEYGDTMRFPGRQIENFFTPRALARADIIAAVSQFTRQRLEHYYPQFGHKVVIMPGASMLHDAGVGGRPGSTVMEEAYFLFVGTLEPRKNLPRLLRAYRNYVAAAPRARQLKIAGGAGWGGDDIASLVREMGLAGQVQLLGKVDDSELSGLYKGAHALLMPSLYEGFGLPIIEALSLGVPVITSRDSAMSEVAGSAGLFVDPYSEEEILNGLLNISSDEGLRSTLAAQAVTEAGRYDWQVTSELMAEQLLL